MGKAGKARKAGKALATAKVYQRQANHQREIMLGRLNVMGITSAVTVLASPDVKLGRPADGDSLYALHLVRPV